MSTMSGWLERLYAPTWAGGWALSRVMFVIAALVSHLPRYAQIQDALSHPEVVFTAGPLRVVEQVTLSAPQAFGLYALGIGGIGMLLWGGRLAKPGLLIWLLSSCALIALTGLSARVPERLFLWVGLILLTAPIGERGLTQKRRSPASRWALVILACALYGSTGWLKATQEPAWWTGEALAYDLVDLHFGLEPMGVWLSGQPVLARLLSWGTIFVECSFPLLIWRQRGNLWILIAAGCVHLGIEMLMSVGTLTLLTLSMYPVLLHPDTAERLWQRCAAGRKR